MNTMIYNLTYNYQINCYNKTIRSIQFWKKLKKILDYTLFEKNNTMLLNQSTNLNGTLKVSSCLN